MCAHCCCVGRGRSRRRFGADSRDVDGVNGEDVRQCPLWYLLSGGYSKIEQASRETTVCIRSLVAMISGSFLPSALAIEDE